MKALALASALVMLHLAGCSASPCARATSQAHSGRVAHAVFCWLKDPADAAARQKIIDATYGFRRLPGVVDVYIGDKIASPRTAVDSSYDLGLVILFKNEQAMRDYEKSDLHQKAVTEVLQPNAKQITIYDFRIAH